MKSVTYLLDEYDCLTLLHRAAMIFLRGGAVW
jgi:hypothetical protein